MSDILSIGAPTVDIFIKSDSFVLDKPFIRLPYSSKQEISQSLITSGGGGTNSAVSFSRLGLKASLLSLLAQDNLSPYILSDLDQNKVDFKLSPQIKSETTDFSIIVVASDGGRTVLVNRGNSRLEASQIPWKSLTNYKYFYITSLEGNLDLLEQLVGFGLENNIKIALNPGSRELAQRQILSNFLKYVDFLLLNQQEAETLVNLKSTDFNFWTTIKTLPARVVAVTNGRQGAHIFSADQTFFSPILNTQPVDETGAGDAFGSAFVAGLFYQKNLATCLDWAIHNSASVVSHLGAKTGLLSLEQIENKN
ncbi:hypothetical protein DRH14_03220 [Candidatus Shapirobacteria bacterium]|nr:MAG: hypothetical protein DRH14_03220 [Candidatus Shapirobacteria bacterium]